MRYLVAVMLLVNILCYAEEREGKIFVKSEPTGVEISLTIGEGENQKFEVLGKTPILAKVPLGKVKLILQMKEYKSAVLELEVKDTTIQKPEAVKLAPILYNIDVLYKEEGWAIWADGKDTGKKTPDTVELQAGDHKVVLKKEGFKDIGKDVKVGEIEFIKNVEFTEEATKAPTKTTIVKEQPKELSKYSGFYKSDKGAFNLDIEKSELKMGQYFSIAGILINNKCFFKWSNGNDLIVIDLNNDNSIIIYCYSTQGDLFDKIKTDYNDTISTINKLRPFFKSKGIK